MILTNNKTKELDIIHKKRIIYTAEYDLNNLGEILRKYIKKGRTGIFSELPDTNYKILPKKIREMYSNDKRIEFFRCSFRALDIETEVEAVKQVSLYHVRESMYSDIQETFNAIRYKIYFPKLLELIQIVISQCDVCQQIKYLRKPKFPETETANSVIYADTQYEI